LLVLTAGIDLAVMPERTALVTIAWARASAVIQEVICPADDDMILGAIEQAAKTGIDCLFGWPVAFAAFVAATAPNMSPSPGRHGCQLAAGLTMRLTDAFVQNTVHAVPLSVSADKIAHVALRSAVLLASVGCQNSATVFDQGFYAARSYSLRRPPRRARHLIRSWEGSAMGWSELSAAMRSSSV
jgi:hypothetical protein